MYFLSVKQFNYGISSKKKSVANSFFRFLLMWASLPGVDGTVGNTKENNVRDFFEPTNKLQLPLMIQE